MNEKTRKLVDYLIARGKEPSTWAGVAVCLVALHVHLPNAATDALGVAGPALAGIAAVLLGE